MVRMRKTLFAAALATLATPTSAAVLFDGALLEFQQVNTLGGQGLETGFGPVFFTVGAGVDVVDDGPIFSIAPIASDFEGDTLTITNTGSAFDIGVLDPFVISLFYTDLFNQLPDLGGATLVTSAGVESDATPVEQALTDALTVSPDVIAFRFDGLFFASGAFVTYRFAGPPEPMPTPAPAPIPLPAAAPLMAAGLAMLLLIGRRRA